MPRIGAYLRQRRDAIGAECARRIQARIPAAQGASHASLADPLPPLIDALADALDREEGAVPEVLAPARRHAQLRDEQAFGLREIVWEYAILRDVLLESIAASPDVPVEARPVFATVQAVDHEVDRAVYEAIRQYVDARDRRRDLFAGMLTHDLRNPLHAARLTLSMMERRGRLDPEDAVALETARSYLVTVSKLVDELAEFMRARLGQGIPVNRAPMDLGGLVRDVFEEFRLAHADRRLVLVEAGALWASADRTRMTQVLNNLLGNALKHGEDPIEVAARSEGGSVVVEVRNRGVIAEAVRDRIFEPFAGREGGGLGLGLFIVREVARAHGGEVEVVTEPGVTSFRVRVPQIDAPADQPRSS